MIDDAKLDALETSNNILKTEINHLEQNREIINNCVLRLDSPIVDDLPIDEVDRLAKEYIDSVRYIQNRIESIININSIEIYAPPDILFSNDGSKLFE